MKKFTHGIIAVDPENIDEDNNPLIVHFIGLWEAPTKEAFDCYSNEIKTDPEFGLVEISDRIVILPAPEDIIEHFNDNIDDYEDEKLL